MTSTTQRLTRELVEFLTPVYLAFGSKKGLRRLLRRLGHDPGEQGLTQALASLSSVQEVLTAMVRSVAAKTWSGQPLDDSDYAAIAAQAPAVFAALRRLPETLTELGPGFAVEILDLLIVDYLRMRAPVVLRALVLTGVVEIEPDDPERYHLRWERLRRFLEDPSGLMGELYGWGGAQFAAGRLLANLAALLAELGVFALPAEAPEGLGGVTGEGLDLALRYLPGIDGSDRELGLLVLPMADGIAIAPYLRGAVDEAMPLGGGVWSLQAQAAAVAAGGLAFRLRPTGLAVDAEDSAGASFRLELARRTDGEEPIVLVEDSAGSRLEADGITFGAGGGPDELYVAVAARGLRLYADASGDGLFATLVGEPIEAEAGDIIAGWRAGRGIYVEAGSGLGVRVPLDRTVAGVLRLREIALRLSLEPDASLAALVSADASIGPLTLGFTDLGLITTLTANPQGSFGAFDLDTRVVYPNGYRVAIESGTFTGGGALIRRDHEYAGSLSLQFETTGFSAFGILTTRLPDDGDDFSFLASIFSESEIPLGYGFFLTGLGGVIGVNRGVDVAALREAVAGGTLDDLLFPADPIAAAPRVLAALAGTFPERHGSHVFGPVARIRFGRPALVEGKLGLVVEVGDRPRVLVVGLISADLPSEQAALVSLRASFFGEVDLAAGTISIDGSLNPGSRVLDYAIGGDIAVRTGWGGHVDHVVSFGGLHPAYPRPANLPELRRLSINFGSNNPRVTLSAYLAVTSNSLQFGAEASLYAKGPKIPFVGRLAAEGEVYLHALLSFDPFAFEASLGGGLSLLVDDEVILGLGFDLRLSGPNPFRVAGRVWATVFGIDVGFAVEHSWGEPRPLAAPVADPVTVLRSGLKRGTGLEPVASSARVSGVVFGPAPEAGAPLVDPAAGLRYLQREVPLGRPIEKVGEAALPGGTHRYDLVVLDGAGVEVALEPATTEFVRGHFWRLTEAEQLRAPALERAVGGFVLGGDDLMVNAAAAVDADLGYEVVGFDTLGQASVEAAVLGEQALTRWSRSHRMQVARPLRPRATAVPDAATLSLRTSDYIGGIATYVAAAAAQG